MYIHRYQAVIMLTEISQLVASNVILENKIEKQMIFYVKTIETD